jgi:hypothetical protein
MGVTGLTVLRFPQGSTVYVVPDYLIASTGVGSVVG